jgi:DNA (cytosine-5)-methyltransferase 1
MRALERWPTPTSRDWKRGAKPETLIARGKSPDNTLCDAVERRADNGGALNPTWVEWLMGYPSGWTDLDASETP